MQTLFKADPYTPTAPFKYAGIGIFFSVDNYNVKLSKAESILIDTFFETLAWKDADPEVNLVTFGDLMSLVDLQNRWVYKGTLTYPPCTKAVYWNILHTVYPIK